MTASKPSKKSATIKEKQSRYLIDERFEIIAGIRYDFLSSPKFVHQKLLTNFHIAFHSSCSLEGEIILAPLDVHFDEENIVQPDLVYISRENLGIIRDDYVFGAPDLVVEILSQSTGRKDKTVKKTLYERFGVKEYWMVDPVYRTVDQFLLEGSKYNLAATLSDQDEISSPVLPCLSIDLSSIFPAEEKQ